jgi:glycosyltransferase involved in cell wall biosynthesis
VARQTYGEIEHIVMDGQSTDGTLQVIEKHRHPKLRVISEKDINLYDAMNKGIRAATGDIVGILNADDFYATPEAISEVVRAFRESDKNIVIGDLQFVDPETPAKVTRFLTSKNFKNSQFLAGYQPPHPSFFVRRALYEKYGTFNIKYPVCADFDLLLRFLYLQKEPWQHLPVTLICMRTGGLSNRGLLGKFAMNKTKLEICRGYGLATNNAKIYSKYLSKFFALLTKKFRPS